ncbi:unnamed protein product [Schistosoma curassoni]|uniref:MBL fold metallo-hydrolase n=1 Tax=Schistosoma curassoni TaxID=6186 RepID=A0A183K9B8_9TREM|nr:unnamed protein product [Schistosoma curassoni]
MCGHVGAFREGERTVLTLGRTRAFGGVVWFERLI